MSEVLKTQNYTNVIANWDHAQVLMKQSARQNLLVKSYCLWNLC